MLSTVPRLRALVCLALMSWNQLYPPPPRSPSSYYTFDSEIICSKAVSISRKGSPHGMGKHAALAIFRYSLFHILKKHLNKKEQLDKGGTQIDR